MLEEIYFAAQIAAGAGVIAGLFFVGVQIRQNTRALRSAAFHGVTDSFNSVNLVIAGQPGLARVVRTGWQNGLAALSDDERLQFSFTSLSAFRVMETLYYQDKVGLADRRLWETEKGTLSVLTGLPGTQDWWRDNKLSFTPEFRQIVDELMLNDAEVHGG